MLSSEVTVTRGVKKYPSPDTSFVSTLLTDELIALVKRYQDNQIPLTAMTNWFETILRREYGSRDGVKKALNIQGEILKTIGRLSESSDPMHGRKAKGHGPAKLSPDEVRWLETVVFVIIKQIGVINAGVASSKQITMADLPPL